mmetsp:Transcript_47494/g.151509  ORF Transcript_47494/g.151509 Transcript_47494/m.151509 type:complete len:432 (+) Transcript_47494:81-1376(+)
MSSCRTSMANYFAGLGIADIQAKLWAAVNAAIGRDPCESIFLEEGVGKDSTRMQRGSVCRRGRCGIPRKKALQPCFRLWADLKSRPLPVSATDSSSDVVRHVLSLDEARWLTFTFRGRLSASELQDVGVAVRTQGRSLLEDRLQSERDCLATYIITRSGDIPVTDAPPRINKPLPSGMGGGKQQRLARASKASKVVGYLKAGSLVKVSEVRFATDKMEVGTEKVLMWNSEGRIVGRIAAMPVPFVYGSSSGGHRAGQAELVGWISIVHIDRGQDDSVEGYRRWAERTFPAGTLGAKERAIRLARRKYLRMAFDALLPGRYRQVAASIEEDVVASCGTGVMSDRGMGWPSLSETKDFREHIEDHDLRDVERRQRKQAKREQRHSEAGKKARDASPRVKGGRHKCGEAHSTDSSKLDAEDSDGAIREMSADDK